MSLLLKIPVNASLFYWLSKSGFKTETSFNEKTFFMRSGEKPLLNFILFHGKKLWVSLVYRNRIVSIFLKLPCKLIYEVYWFRCLLVCSDRYKENCAYRPSLFVTNVRHPVSITPENWEFVECAEPRKLSDFRRSIDRNMKKKKRKGFYQEGNTEN